MSITYTIDKNHRFIHRIVTGTVTSDEILAHITEILQHPDCLPGMKSLTELRAIQQSASPEDIRQIANFILGRSKDVQGGTGGHKRRKLRNGTDAGVAY